ncbi:hypothetical protein M501DRAFT_929168 [Patellaria atrata CBS 101060]|uniref:Ubiquitin-like domain-containing protein n=1 Tax=Patellaria atrata CBS 101060 TaxID=1346257 RepID=A0A9P4SFD4_9PEZI|nr:hypothetical protein M501DRAFT_929168 [Patellaria atrata CBS 101060]
MTELSFARQFLAALDTRPVKLSSDYIADPKQYPASTPTILPKHSTPKRKRAPQSADPSSTPKPASSDILVTLKCLKPPSYPLTLPSSPTTSIHELKTAYSTHIHVLSSKIKVLWQKKPVLDSKVLKELLGGEGGDMPGDAEFTIMVLGGAVPTLEGPKENEAEPEKMDVDPPTAPVAQGPSGAEVVQTKEFWEDLKGFLVQRVRDEAEGERLVELFKNAWESRGSRP